MMKGKFIVFEGNDGSGKSTQILKVEKYLKEKGYKVVTTREPGGTEVGFRIRKLLLDPAYKMDGLTEALLLAADRNEHVKNVLIPALEDGYVVICDRYILSSIVYQGIVRGVGVENIIKLNSIFEEKIKPDLYIILTLSPEIALQRLKMAGKNDKLDTENFDFHRKVYNGFKEVSKRFEKCVNIEAEGTVEDVFEKVRKVIDDLLKKR
ncbi:dTMP kinase [Caldicellulosiruptor changbaiensis]|uniref:Thymidylate kinase n=1 Tax=Caldicellulosiruptor changbaiensis TaxID=1222016 RepID=A0A3T0D7P1_9FIRM|nr:dTMP kinase [Caldicellulosiruptor changbaiensis]AZT91147.1 dTMP kinase [Caldicellulosiruptor changbaiensis]